MRTKNYVHTNSVISNIYIMDEILQFDFQISHLAHSLAAAASKCRYITSIYNVANLAEPWSTRRSRLTRGVYFRAPRRLSQPAAAVAAYTCTSNPGTAASRQAYYCVE